MLTRRHTLGLLAAAPATALALPALASTAPVFSEAGIAIRGADPVVYFTEATHRIGWRLLRLRHVARLYRFECARGLDDRGWAPLPELLVAGARDVAAGYSRQHRAGQSALARNPGLTGLAITKSCRPVETCRTLPNYHVWRPVRNTGYAHHCPSFRTCARYARHQRALFYVNGSGA